MNLEGLNLPSSVLARVKHAPGEDIGLAIFREGLPGLEIYSEVPMATPPLFVLVRRTEEPGVYGSRRGLIDELTLLIYVYAENPDGDDRAALVCDALIDVADEAWREHWRFSGLGSVNKLECTQGPQRVTDWATSVGPVQYADLPTGDWRYEMRFNLRINPPRV